jgi:alpha-beta hydrolase superfamily lysophospholipase
MVFPSWYPRGSSLAALPPCTKYQTQVYGRGCQDVSRATGVTPLSFETERTVEGRKISASGWLFPAEIKQDRRRVMILVHGAGADRRAMIKHVPYLRKAGFDVGVIDCHNHGLSPRNGRGISLGVWEMQSVLAAVDWTKTHFASEDGGKQPWIGLMGTSQGAVAVLSAASQSTDVQAVVAENPYLSVQKLVGDFPAMRWVPGIVLRGALGLSQWWIGQTFDVLDIRQMAAGLKATPVFLIHAEDDKVVPVAHSREILSVLNETKGAPRESWFVRGGGHEMNWNSFRNEFEDRTLRFLDVSSGVKRTTVDNSPVSQKRDGIQSVGAVAN